MSQDYDLVIIGTTAAATTAAIEAINLRARVALVLPTGATVETHARSDLYAYALAQIAATTRRDRARKQPPSSYPWKYAQMAVERVEQQQSPALLAAMGVDTIFGMGEFCYCPNLAFQIDNRYLRAKAYLVATGALPPYPFIPGIHEVGYLTSDRLAEVCERDIPLKWAIIGSEAIGIELAQTLARLGCEVAVIVESPQILPYEDPSIANFIQAQLEADGVEIYLESTVTNISNDGDCKLVVTNDEAIAVDEIFIAQPERPFVEPFNLAGVGVQYRQEGISIDDRLRTSQKRIYACGSVCGNVFGGYRSDSLARNEAISAVRNALSRHQTKLDYRSYDRLPWGIYTDPPLARVGMKIPADFIIPKSRSPIVLKCYFKDCQQAVLNNVTSGFCRLALSRSGRILGAEIVGQNAPELIQILAIAIRERMTIAKLASIPHLLPSYIEIIELMAREWDRYERDRKDRSSWIERLVSGLLDR